MRLHQLTLALLDEPQFRAALAPPPGSQPHALGVPDPAKAVTIAAIALTSGPTVVIAPNAAAATTLLEELPAWLGPGRAVLAFPEHGTLPYERQAPPASVMRERLRALAALAADAPAVVVASARSAAQRTLAPERLRAVEIERSSRLSPDAFVRELLTLGYVVTPLADSAGTVARRGGIIDVFAPEADTPIRIEWFGDEIESLRQFDPVTQRSGRTVDRASFGPASEMYAAFEQGAGQRLRELADGSALRGDAAGRFAEEMASLGEGLEHDAFYAPFVAGATLLRHLRANAVLVFDEPADIAGALRDAATAAETARDELERAGELPRGLPLPFATWDELSASGPRRQIELARWATGETGGAARIAFGGAPAFGGQLRALVAEAARLAGEGATVVVATQQAARLRELFEEAAIAVSDDGAAPAAGRIIVAAGVLAGGWTHGVDGGRIVLLTDTEAFGFRKQRRSLPRQERRASGALLAELSAGDYIVHIEHGIARFAGLVQREADGLARDYLELHYAEGDKLWVPVDQIDRVSRYVGPSDQQPSLTRLSSGEWGRAKARVRRAVAGLAHDLLDLYAAREVAVGHAFPPDQPWQQELEASFPYIETPDQLAAIRATKADMELERPMDRLICGDVGYGKTEVAIRAAFKAVLDGVQVAVLVPTTVLAQQHFRTFSERLAGFPMRIEMLSRFRSEKEQRATVEALRSGDADIVIGTHRLLQKDVSFQNLGLVIIDEEQRFGVGHKERLKAMRREVDVLTLTATPIPRTLHMALAGIRDMSTIETPPELRQPIRTYVAEFDDRLVRDAIRRELGRGGQVYFVHNRVRNIEQLAGRLRDLVPEANIVVGHGQMHEDQLEQVMVTFAAGDADVLVCTTIIESGIDIPNVNTIIVHNADKFGLAQLYQLRGRVGRSAARAYAYLVYEKGRVLTEVARRRMQAIFEATELSAGLGIAMRDLEIRGAGNLLGGEQSGHIGAVGFDLYTRMLAEAVTGLRALQRGQPPPRPKPSVEISFDLPIAAFLPERYVAGLSLRLALYQRMSEVRTVDEATELARELRERFGPLPLPARQLVWVAALRAAAQNAGVESIARESATLVAKLSDDAVARLNERRHQIDRAAPDGVRIGPTRIRFDLRALGDSWQDTLMTIIELVAPHATAPPELAAQGR